MKTLLPCLIVPVLLAGVGYCVHAQDAAAMPTAGKVLLLKNGHVMEGDIEQVGAQLRVRRGPSEVWINADLAARLCADWNDAYLFMKTLVNDDNAGDHVALARWCNMHHMNDKAMMHAKRALELRPDHVGATQIVTLLERTMRDPAGKSAPVSASVPVSVPAKSADAPFFVDVTAETAIAFTTKVQPILMNTCANCHANGSGGKFVLERVSEGGQKVATQRNLAAVLNFIDMDRPTISPLLTKAVSPHGAATPPIKDRSAKPFVALKDWLDLTIAKNPQLKEYHAAKKGVPAKNMDQPKTTFGTHQSSAAPVQRENVVAVQQPQAAFEDEFDPRIFNDSYHPRARPQQTADSR